jgi:hypothetical protein
MPTRDVPLAYHEIALYKSFHMIAYVGDNPDELVANCHRHRNRCLRPRVPVVNVNIGAADRSFQNANEHVVTADLRNGNFFEPQSGLGPGLHDGLHRFLHTMMLSADFADSRRFLSKRFKLPRINANRDVCISVYLKLSRISIFDLEIPARGVSAICLATRTPSVLFSLTV